MSEQMRGTPKGVEGHAWHPHNRNQWETNSRKEGGKKEKGGNILTVQGSNP